MKRQRTNAEDTLTRLQQQITTLAAEIEIIRTQVRAISKSLATIEPNRERFSTSDGLKLFAEMKAENPNLTLSEFCATRPFNYDTLRQAQTRARKKRS